VQRIDTIRVFCDVPENDVPHLHVGDPAIVKPSGFDGKAFMGNVTRFSLRLDPETRNMRTEIDLPNPWERLYPGTYAVVSLEMNRRPDALTVPTAAVGSDGDGNFVYSITDNRIARLAIMTGLTDNGRTEVTAGPIGRDPGGGKHQGRPATDNGCSAADDPQELLASRHGNQMRNHCHEHTVTQKRDRVGVS
jgi:multidrug efflux pump subunit AcrA (membrane-fusion protein)